MSDIRSSAEDQWMSVAQELEDFHKLPIGWDGYSGIRTTPRAYARAILMLSDLVIIGADPPQIVPSADGGVQIEWHNKCGSVEILIQANGTAEWE